MERLAPVFSCKQAYEELSRKLVKADVLRLYHDFKRTDRYRVEEQRAVATFVRRNRDIIVTFNQIVSLSDSLADMPEFPDELVAEPARCDAVMETIEDLIEVCYYPVPISIISHRGACKRIPSLWKYQILAAAQLPLDFSRISFYILIRH